MKPILISIALSLGILSWQAFALDCDPDLKGPFPAEHGYGTATDDQFHAWMRELGEGPRKKRVDAYRVGLQRAVLAVRDSGALVDQVLDDLVVCMAQDIQRRGVPGLDGAPVSPALVGHRIWECQGTLDCSGPTYPNLSEAEASKSEGGCVTRLAPDGCNWETLCPDGTGTTTLMHCGREYFTQAELQAWVAETAPKDDESTPDGPPAALEGGTLPKAPPGYTIVPSDGSCDLCWGEDASGHPVQLGYTYSGKCKHGEAGTPAPPMYCSGNNLTLNEEVGVKLDAIDPQAETAQVSWCTGPWTLGCEGGYKTATIPIVDSIDEAVVVEPSAVGWKWFHVKHAGPQGCLFTGKEHPNGRDFPAPDGSGRAGFFSEGFAPIMGVAGGSCARFGITTDHGLLSGY